jgi:hypothetical protein
MLRAERISGLDKVRDEIEVYNSLIPEPGELSATLLLEIEDQADLRARFEEGRRKDKISAGQVPGGKRVEQVFN